MMNEHGVGKNTHTDLRNISDEMQKNLKNIRKRSIGNRDVAD